MKSFRNGNAPKRNLLGLLGVSLFFLESRCLKLAVVRQLKEGRVPPEKDCSGEVVKRASGGGERERVWVGSGQGRRWRLGVVERVSPKYWCVCKAEKHLLHLTKFSNYCQPLGSLDTSLFSIFYFQKPFKAHLCFSICT